jgi:phage portal protein BeeE
MGEGREVRAENELSVDQAAGVRALDYYNTMRVQVYLSMESQLSFSVSRKDGIPSTSRPTNKCVCVPLRVMHCKIFQGQAESVHLSPFRAASLKSNPPSAELHFFVSQCSPTYL